MRTKIRQIGTSLGLTIPKRLIDQAGFREGQEVSLTASMGTVIISGRAHIEVSLTLDEARALAAGEHESVAAASAREKIREQFEQNF